MLKKLDAIKIIQQKGEQYGFYYTQETGLQFDPQRAKINFGDKWEMTADITQRTGIEHKTAVEVYNAIERMNKLELNQTIKKAEKLRNELNNKDLRDLAEHNLDLLRIQKQRLSEKTEIADRIFDIRNIHRASSIDYNTKEDREYKSFRQTPTEKTTIEGLKALDEHLHEKFNAVINSYEGQYFLASKKSQIKSLCESLGVSFEDLYNKHFKLQAEEKRGHWAKDEKGLPYLALERAYTELFELLYEKKGQIFEYKDVGLDKNNKDDKLLYELLKGEFLHILKL